MSGRGRRRYIKPWRLPKDDLFYRQATRFELVKEFVNDKLLHWLVMAAIIAFIIFLFFPETTLLLISPIVFWR